MTHRSILRALAIVGLLVALAVVRVLEKIFGKRVWIALVVLAAVVGFAIRFGACDRDSDVRVGTYNIRRFGVENTDMRRLTGVVASTRADVLALQEIQSEAKVADLAKRLSTAGRSFAFKLSTCGGRSEMRVGFLYDEKRVALVTTREFPELAPDERGSCNGERPGLLGTFSRGAGGTRFQLLVFHLIAGGDAEKIAKRKAQWRLAHRIAKDARAAGPIAILGDTNSTGYLDDRGGERTFIDAQAEQAGMVVETRPLGCSEYFQPEPPAIRPSLLDHVVATPGFARAGSVRLHGYCAELACHPTSAPPEEYTVVSDHCPVTIDLP
jgi:endonuclease/exonuclease/phosphatase family metal-dependent hydrolase